MMLYSMISDYYDRIFPLNPAIVSFLTRYVRDSDTVLDIGSGTGTLTHEMSKHCQQIVGIDPSAQMIRESRRKYPELTFREAGVLEIQDQHFDMAFSTGNTVSYFSPTELKSLAEHVFFLLPEQGFWVYQTVNWDFLKNHRSYEFPVVELDEGVFIRRYDFPGPEIADFHLIIRRPGKPDIQETHRLYRLIRDTHLEIHLQAGFRLIACFHNWNRDPWLQASAGATILVFKKSPVV